MRVLYTLFIILFWFNQSLGQSEIDTIEYKTQILDLESFNDTLYLYKIDIVRDIRCILINCPIKHYEGIEYREFYLIRDNKLVFQKREYPEFKEKIIKVRNRW